MLNKRLVIFGCGGHARSLADVAIQSGYDNIVFIDDYARPDEIQLGFPVLKSTEFNENDVFIAAQGDNAERAKCFESNSDKAFVAVISKTAHVGIDAEIGKGTFVGQDVHIGPLAKIGENTIINTKSLVEHDCVIGSNTHVSVGAVVAGKCSVGDNCFIGAGSVMRDGTSVCSDVTVGAGAVVVKDITEPGIYVGAPAKKIK